MGTNLAKKMSRDAISESTSRGPIDRCVSGLGDLLPADPAEIFSNGPFQIPDTWKGYAPYREIIHNKYASATQRSLVYSIDSPPECTCVDECGMECCNRELYMECDPATCPTRRSTGATHCANSALQRQSFPKTEVCRTRFCGYGLRLLEKVAAGTIIMEYTGEVIDTKEFDKRRKGLRPQDDFYFASLCRNFMLDAKPAGSRARFANHSCKPNCELQKWSVMGEPRLALVAMEDLDEGTELNYNYRYSEDGMDKVERVQRQKCLCGHSCCSGIIGGRVEKSLDDKWNLRCEGLTSGERVHAISVLKAHISTAPDRTSVAAVELQRQIEEIENWIKLNIVRYLDNACEIVEFDCVQNILNGVPLQHIKCDEIVVLQEKLKLCSRTEKSIEKMNAQIKETGLKLDWASSISLLRDVYDCLPIRCTGASSLFESLQMVFQWAENILRHFGSIQRLIAFNTSSKSGFKYSYIDEVARAYETPLSSRAYFILETYLEGRLSLFISRQNIITASHSSGVSTKESIYSSIRLLKGMNCIDDVSLKAASRAQSHNFVYCVCRLPEDDAETATLIQCDSCEEWYHPFCINVKGYEDDDNEGEKSEQPLSRKRKAKQNEIFTCPFCNLRDNKLSSLTHPICGEWSDSLLTSKSRGLKKAPTLNDIASLASDRAKEDIEAMGCAYPTSPKRHPNFRSHNILLSPNAQVVQQPDQEKSGNRKLISKKALESAPLDLEEIKNVNTYAANLPIVNISIFFLTQLMERYANEWLVGVADFWTSHMPFLQSVRSDLFNISGSLDDTYDTTSCAIAAEAMYLYSELRIIGIRCNRETICLRLLVWALSARVLLRRSPQYREVSIDPIKTESRTDASQPLKDCSLENRIVNNILYNQRNCTNLASADEMNKVVQAGFSLLTACKSLQLQQNPPPTDSHESVAFNLVFDIAWAVALGMQEVLDSIKSCLSMEALHSGTAIHNALVALDEVSDVVDMIGMFGFARLMNKVMPCPLKDTEVHESSAINETGEIIDSRPIIEIESGSQSSPSGTTSSNELYCWCRYTQYGNMVCCDACGQWFHTGCMGLTRGKLKDLGDFTCIRCCEANGAEYPHKWAK